MRKFMFAALAGVFMLSSGFEKSVAATNDISDKEELLSCQCRCTSYTLTFIGTSFYITSSVSYTSGAQACDAFGGGDVNDYDSDDCRDGGGMLNARRVEDLQAAEQGTGC